MIIDTHCHYNLEPLFSKQEAALETWQDHWQTAQKHGVSSSIVIGTSLETSRRAIDIASQEPSLFAAVGIHPNEYTRQNKDAQQDYDQLHKLLSSHQKIVAVGETGLDYYRLNKTAPEFAAQRQSQQAGFSTQIEIANTHQVPLILHVRDTEMPEVPTLGNAYWDVLDVLQEKYNWHQPVILHCASGPMAYVQAMLNAGAYCGLAGNVTYPNATAVREIVKNTPPDKILLETDAPYLTPQSHRGEICEPWMISKTAQYLENELSLNLDQIYQNTLDLFPGLKS